MWAMNGVAYRMIEWEDIAVLHKTRKFALTQDEVQFLILYRRLSAVEKRDLLRLFRPVSLRHDAVVLRVLFSERFRPWQS